MHALTVTRSEVLCIQERLEACASAHTRHPPASPTLDESMLHRFKGAGRRFKLGARLEERLVDGACALVVSGVDPESVAFSARLGCGDVLLSVNSLKISCFADLAGALSDAKEADSVTVQMRRLEGGVTLVVIKAEVDDDGPVSAAAMSAEGGRGGPGQRAGGSQFEWLGALGAPQRDLQELWKELKCALP